MKFNFYQREEGEKVAKKSAIENLDLIKRYKNRETYKKQDIKYLLHIGGSGMGKTRSLLELRNILLKIDSKKYSDFQNTLQIYIDFFNGDKILVEESKKPDDLLGIRIFSRFFRNQTIEEFKNEKDFEIYSNSSVFNLRIVLDFLNDYMNEYNNSNNIKGYTPIVINLDEIQYTLNRVDGEWKDIRNNIGSYIWGRKDKIENYNLILIPSIGGTKINDIKFDPTEYDFYEFKLDSFKIETLKKILSDEKIDQYENEKIKSEFYRFWILCSLIPRDLEKGIKIFVDRYNNLQESTQNEIQIDIEFMNECYNEMKIENLNREIINDAKDLLLILFSNLDYGKLGKYYGDKTEYYIEKGILHKTSDNRIFTSHFIFKKLCEFTSILPSDLLPDLKTSITWQLFEKLDLFRLSLLFHYRKDINFGELHKIRNIFPGYANDDILDIEIKYNEKKYALETNPFIELQNKKLKYFSTKPIEITKRKKPLTKEYFFKFIFQLPLNHPKFDGRLFIKNLDQSCMDYLIFIQYKHTSEEETEKNPIHWYNDMILRMKNHFTDYDKIYVFITNGKINENQKKKILDFQDLIVIDNDKLQEYMNPNIYSYFGDLELLTVDEESNSE